MQYLLTNTMAYWYDGAALAATRSPVIALFWCLIIKFTTTGAPQISPLSQSTNVISLSRGCSQLCRAGWCAEWDLMRSVGGDLVRVDTFVELRVW